MSLSLSSSLSSAQLRPSAPPDRLAALQQARSSEERITSHRHRPITHWFVFAAMICLIAGILLRRV